MTTTLDTYLAKAANDLPAMPMVAGQIVKAIDNADSSVDEIRALVEQDPGLVARILRVSNSAYYGFPSEIRSVGHAISLLGGRTVRNLVLGASLKGSFRRFGLMEKLLWEHAAIAGPVAAALAKREGRGIDADEAFTAALLHDVGKAALANSHRDEYEKVFARVYNEGVGFVQAERDGFGFDHAELGSRVAEHWKLPPRLANVIRFHHEPEAWSELSDSEARLTALIALCSAILTKLGVGRRDPIEEVDLTTLPSWQRLGYADSDVEPIEQLCREQVELARSLTD